MLKIKCLILLVVLSFSSLVNADAESVLFARAFPNRPQSHQTKIPLYYNKWLLGEVDINVNSEGNEVNYYLSKSLIDSLKTILIEAELKKIENLNKDRITDSDLSFKINYNTEELKLIADIPLLSLIPRSDNYSKERNVIADLIIPADFSGAINIKSGFSIYRGLDQSNQNETDLSSFFNFKSYVLENQAHYSSVYGGSWVRTGTTIIKDDTARAVRYSVGDITSRGAWYSESRTLGGISIAKNYSITPDEVITPGNYNEFIITGKSEVKYLINGSIVKVSNLDPGKYSIQDLPLNNGLNTITIEVTDEFGIKKFINFDEPFSSSLIKEGKTRYDFSVGKKSSTTRAGKVYDQDGDLEMSGVFERGWTQHFTNSIYGQRFDSSYLIGQENQFSTMFGGIRLGNAFSKSSSGAIGYANNIEYSLGIKTQSGSRHSFGLSVEDKSLNFKSNVELTDNSETSKARRIYRATYSHPFTDLLSLGLGVTKSVFFNEKLPDSFGVNVNLRKKFNSTVSSTISLDTKTTEYNRRVNSVGFFLNFSLAETSLSTSYDLESGGTNINYSRRPFDNGISPSASLSSDKNSKSSKVATRYENQYGNISLSDHYTVYKDGLANGVSNINLSSSFVFALDKGKFRSGICPPVNDSALIIYPNKTIKKQKISLIGSNGRTGEQGLFNEIVKTDLTSYRYSGAQLDPSHLEDGYALGKESFTVLPSYKSVSMVEVGQSGSVALKGILRSPKGPLSDISGEARSNDGGVLPFFTNKGGRFFIESVSKGEVTLTFPDSSFLPVNIKIEDDQFGLIDLGEIDVH